MAALDIAKALHDQIWTLLEADTGFSDEVKPGNRIKTSEDGYLAKLELKRNPGDYPMVIVRVTGKSINKPESQVPKVFGQNAATFTSATADYGIPGTLTASVKVVYDKMNIASQTPVESYIDRAIYSKGPRLGLNSWVNGFTLDMKRTDKKDSDAGYVLRTVSEYTMVISIRPKLSQITAA